MTHTKPDKKSSPLHKLFARQLQKHQPTANSQALLKTFAEDDYQQIARVIKSWLKKAEQNDKPAHKK